MRRLIAALALLAIGLLPALGLAHDTTIGPFEVTHSWARFTPKGAPNGAVYMVIENTGPTGDRLVGASTPRAERVEMHRSAMDGELMTMKPQDAVELKPGEIVEFAPGGLHLMLLKLTAPLQVGERFPLTLRFETAGEFSLEVEVEKGVAEDKLMDGHHQME